MKFLLLHDLRNDDGIKQFFSDVHELYVKVGCNQQNPDVIHDFDVFLFFVGQNLHGEVQTDPSQSLLHTKHVDYVAGIRREGQSAGETIA